MVPITYRSFDPLTLAYLGRLPLDSVTFQRRFSGDVGQLRGTLSLASAAGASNEVSYATLLQSVGDTALARSRLRQMIRAARVKSLLIADAGGTPVWWGYIASNPYDSASGACTILAKEPWAAAQMRLLRADLDYGSNGINLKDQTTDIFRGLLNWMLSETAWSNLQWDTSQIAASGVLRERHYVGVERHYVGELCQNLADLQNGFQFVVDCTYDSGNIPHLTVRTGYPRLGRRYSASDPGGTPRLTFPGTLLQYSWGEDESAYATVVDAISRNQDGSVNIATATNQALRDQGYPEQSAAVNFDNVTDLTGTLSEHAAATAQKLNTPVGIPTIQATAEAVLGYVFPGDDLQLSFQDWRFPDRTQLVVRTLGYDVDVDQGTANLMLDMTI